MNSLRQAIESVDVSTKRTKQEVLDELINHAEAAGYNVVDVNVEKPWGAFVRFDTSCADDFIGEFFLGLSPKEARLGHDNMELSPKFLVVSPGARLSWQKHYRRAERWAFLTEAGYHKSETDDEGELQVANAGDVVQFEAEERHRLVGVAQDSYALVAEIWQHIDPAQPSDEDDITRIQDDYAR